MKGLSLVLASISTAFVAADISGDAVPSLPGAPALMSKMWSGYLEVDSSTGQNLHYVFAEAEKDPANAPVVLWLNGGPGCSSMDGFMYENGPFHVDEQDFTKLVVNDGRWTQSANMLWLEAPAGVGFSYAKDRSVYSTNDTQTADFNHKALAKFFEGFPEYSKNSFFISGESYAGVYVPTLALKTVMSQSVSPINLQGILVGNGCTGTEVGVCGPDSDRLHAEYLQIRNTYSPVLAKQIESSCSPDWHNPSSECEQALQQMSVEVGNINLYGIYYSCNAPIERPNPKLTLPVAKGSVLDLLGGPVACIESKEAHAYLNSDVVAQALHVSAAKQYWNEWTICTNKIRYTPTAKNLPRDVYPVLLEHGLRVRIYNGDADACVPVNDNLEWTMGMNYPIANGWRSWETQLPSGPIVSGYSVDYKPPSNGSFSFTTIMGAGHETPTYKPIQSLDMFTRFINNQPF